MSKHRTTPLFILGLIVGDVLAILGAYSLAYIFRVKLSDDPVANFVAAEPYFLSLLTLLPFIVLFLVMAGTYRITATKVAGQITRVVIGALVAMLSLVTIDYFYNDHIFPAKLVPLYGLGISIVLLAVVRVVLYAARWAWWYRGKNLQSIVIIGGDYTARDLAEDITRRSSGYTLQAVVGDKRFSFTTHRTFAEAVAQATPDIIIQIASPKSPAVNQTLVDYAIKNYTELKFIPLDVASLPNTARFELFMGDIPVLDIRQTALTSWGRLVKRVFDFILASIALVLLSPVFLIVSIVNYFLFGKIFFGQPRLTRGNRIFRLYKFQSIPNTLNGLSPEEAFTKLGKPELIKTYRENGDFLLHDPRFGTWGRFIRKMSLDELPQFWNVVRGDISLVGPRALVPEELNAYEKKHLILTVRSGITGLAQISGRRGLPWEQRRKLDIYYAQNWTFGLDLRILMSTAWQVLTGRGAE